MPQTPPPDLLTRIDSPADLRRLEKSQLPALAQELRTFLIDSVAATGGHLAPGLGVVELTIALHYIFNTPEDRLIWDVGHQAYPHKILTGRRHQMHTLRQRGGLSGFPKRHESPYDTFGTGHASTSISAALGMAVAARAKGEERQVVAVIGDASMGGGMAFEAMNQAGALDLDLLVILNDNDWAISPSVGGFRNHLAKLLSGDFYQWVREGGKSALSGMPQLSDFVSRWEEHLKGMVMPGTLFEELGFNSIGPIDGHDLDTLTVTLHNMRQMRGPRLLHVVTQKGKGYEPAEGSPSAYHGVTPFNTRTGRSQAQGGGLSYTQIFGDWICDAAAADARLIAITPAMCEGSGLVRYANQFPERYFDVGIAEEHALTFAAGLACEGLKPVVAIYSTFLQRAYDQLIHDIALQQLDVTFAVDRAGLVGADGATHAGILDLGYCRAIPNIVVIAPADERECRQLLHTAYLHPGPAIVRYPRGCGPGTQPLAELETLPLGKAELRRQGQRVLFLAFGSMVTPCQQVAAEMDAGVVNMRFVKPLDEQLILQLLPHYQLLVTVEESQIQGGAGSAVAELLAAHGIVKPLLQLGLPDRFIDHASQAEQLHECGLDHAGIRAAVLKASLSLTGRAAMMLAAIIPPKEAP